MTQYKINDKIITELTGDPHERSLYLRQARKEYETSPYNMSFLPITPLAKNADMFCYDLTRETYSTSEKSYLEADKYILKKTLETTFEQGNMDFNSLLITQMGGYGGKQEPRNAAAYQEIVAYAINAQLQNNPSWIDGLNTAAKLTYINIMGERNLSNAIARVNLDYPTEQQEQYIAGNIAADILQKDSERLTKSYNRSEKSIFSWDMQAQLLKTSLNGNVKANMVTPVFMNLLNTIETDNRSNSGRSERVNILTDLISEMGKHHFSNLPLPEDWADKVPACDGAQKLFYNGIYLMGLSDKGVFRNSVNDKAFNNARQEVSAQKLIDDLTKRPRNAISNQEMDLLAQFRPEALLACKTFDPQTKIRLLKHYNLNIPENKRLTMMTEALREKKEIEPWKDGALKDEDIKYFLDSAAKLKTVSPEMNKFIQEIKPIVEKKAEQYNQDAAYVKEGNAKQEEKNQAKAELDATVAAGQDLYYLANAIEAVKKSSSDKEDYLRPENLEIIVRNAIAGKEPKKLVFQKAGKISSLFNGKQENIRQANLEQAVLQFNATLPQLSKHKNIFDEISAPLNNDTYRGELSEKIRAAQTKYHTAETEFSEYRDLDWKRDRMYAYEKENCGNKFEKLVQSVETRRAALKGKARENLAFTYKGQEFNGDSIFTEHEKKTKKIYKTKAEELRGKIKDAAREEMESRGVYEKPDIEEPNKAGTKISKESSSKVTKLMRDKKLYEKLSTKQ